jgi:hypothetical protein
VNYLLLVLVKKEYQALFHKPQYIEIDLEVRFQAIIKGMFLVFLRVVVILVPLEDCQGGRKSKGSSSLCRRKRKENR